METSRAIEDSGERKLAGSVEMVVYIVQEGRERKLRPLKLMMTGRNVRKLLELRTHGATERHGNPEWFLIKGER